TLIFSRVIHFMPERSLGTDGQANTRKKRDSGACNSEVFAFFGVGSLITPAVAAELPQSCFGSGAHQHSRTATLFSVRVSRLFPCARLSHHECRGIFRCYQQGCPFPGHPCSRLLRSIPCPYEFLSRCEGFDRYRPFP